VVSFATGGIPDMVIHQQNGYLAEYKNTEDFTRGLHWIYQHPDKEKLNINARETVMNKFSEEIIAQKHLKLYQQILSK
jgi:glycosyltransferase involved in cell wall biosynthesis